MMYQDYKVGEHKANKGLRFLNYIIDLILILVLTIILIAIFAGILTFTSPDSDILYELDNINPFLDRIITMLFYFFLMFLSEYLTKGRSIAKYITGTKVVMIDGSAPTTKDYFTRNICRIIPFDAITFLGENGWHDKISKTTVVNKKAFETDLSQENNIESIGQSEN